MPRKRAEWEKMSPDPYRICCSEILDLRIFPDPGHEYLIFQLSMTKDLAKTSGGLGEGMTISSRSVINATEFGNTELSFTQEVDVD